jgi:phosphatidylserine/phosphatidylglycerophosphate/cardiolipin synthase-like enzyme
MTAGTVVPLFDDRYQDVLIDLIMRARRRIWASIYIVDLRVHSDPFLTVREVAGHLEEAVWRHVDVRLIIGSSKTPAVRHGNRTSARYLLGRGLDVRMSASQPRLHSKYVIFDDGPALVGGHNWTHNAFTSHSEASVAVDDPRLVATLSAKFESEWEMSGES